MVRDEPGYSDVLFRVERGIGWITLNRPRAINALTHDMVRHFDGRLAAWAGDDGVQAVVLTGAGERGLCAGGDIVALYADACSGGRASIGFWRDEYVLNDRIAGYPKPYVAIMDGIVMGGGVGVSAHGGIRVVTDRTMLAMPEVGIGLVPDVGATWLLSRTPGELGTHLALTGARIGAGDAIACGLADHYLPADRIPALLGQLTGDAIGPGRPAAGGVTALPAAAPDSPLLHQQAWIDTCYAPDTVPEILGRLRAHPDPAARRAAAEITAKSPTAVSVTLRALRRGRQLSTLREALDTELGILTAALTSHDLVEGIRAQVIDKDRAPRWSPASLADVTPAIVDRYFAAASARR